MKTAAVANTPKAGALKLLLVGFVVGSGLVGGFLFADVLGLVLGGVLSLFVANLLLPGNANPEQEKAEQEQFERWCEAQNQPTRKTQENDDWFEDMQRRNRNYDDFCRRNDLGRYSD